MLWSNQAKNTRALAPMSTFPSPEAGVGRGKATRPTATSPTVSQKGRGEGVRPAYSLLSLIPGAGVGYLVYEYRVLCR